MLKIGLVLDDSLDKPDGVQQYVTILGEYLKSIGHDVHYLVAETMRDDLSNIHSLTRYASMKFNQNNVRTPLPSSSKTIKSLLSRLDLDVIHVQMPYSPLFAGKVIRFAPKRTKIVGTFHILPASKTHALANIVLRVGIMRSLYKFDKIMAVSKPAGEFAKRIYGIDSVVVPNCVDLSRFVPTKQIKSHYPTKRIVFLGRFVKRKGAEELVRALRELVGTYNINNLEVVMAGKGPDLESVKALAYKMGLKKIISFPGFIDEDRKANLLQTADIAVFPSLGGESFGIVLVEAMAAGAKIVLGGDNPGYSSVLGDRPELLFNPRDPNVFADKLRTMLLNRDVASITNWQAEHVKQFGVAVVAKQILGIYAN